MMELSRVRRYYEAGFDLQNALGCYVRNEMVEQVKISPFYWEPYEQSDPRKRPIFEKFMNWLGLAHLVCKPPIQCYYHMLMMKDMLATDLYEGRLLAFGYVLPRQPLDAPIAIPSDAWKGIIGWVSDEVEGAGIRFVAVRIVDADRMAEVDTEDTAASEGETSIPSTVVDDEKEKPEEKRKASDLRKEAARQACLELLSENLIDGGMPQKERVRLIVAKLAVNEKTRRYAERMKGMDERTVDGYFADLLSNRLK